MPMLQTFVGELNRQFAVDRIQSFAKERQQHFAPGQGLDLTFLAQEGTPLHRAWRSYLTKLPPSISESIRAVIHSALATSPPTQVTFAWAPGYDYELTIWQAPDTKETRGGVTVLIKSRYPADKHPIEQEAAAS